MVVKFDLCAEKFTGFSWPAAAAPGCSEPNFKIKSEMKSEKMRENAKNKEKIKETEIYFIFNAKSA